jgi:flagellar protein FlbT
MMMYLDPDAGEQYYNDFALRMTEFMGAIQNHAALAACIEISRNVMGGAYYKALMQCRKLFEFEQERLTYDPESIPEYAVHY